MSDPPDDEDDLAELRAPAPELPAADAADPTLRARLQQLDDPSHDLLTREQERSIARRMRAQLRRAIRLVLSTHAGLTTIVLWLEAADRMQPKDLFSYADDEVSLGEIRALARSLRADLRPRVHDLRVVELAARSNGDTHELTRVRAARTTVARQFLRQLWPVFRSSQEEVERTRRELHWASRVPRTDPGVRALEDDHGETFVALLERLGRLERTLSRWQALRDRLAAANQRLAVHWARRAVGKGLPMARLIDAAANGALRATAMFEARRAYRFSTYATWWIRQACSDALEANERGPGESIRTWTAAGETLLVGEAETFAGWTKSGPGRPACVDVLLEGPDAREVGRVLRAHTLSPPVLYDVLERRRGNLDADVAEVCQSRGLTARSVPAPKPVPPLERLERALVDRLLAIVPVDGRWAVAAAIPAGQELTMVGRERDSAGRWIALELRRSDADPLLAVKPAARIVLDECAGSLCLSWDGGAPEELPLPPRSAWRVTYLVDAARRRFHGIALEEAEGA